MTETNSAIELNGVSKSFGETVAVDDVDLGVEAGTVHVLIGPSGCGKSTLLRLVMALAEPDRGTIRVGGRPLEQRNRRAVRRQMGYVIQSGGLFPHLTARENVALPAENVGWSRDRIDRRLGELSELTRFPETEFDQYPSELSGGQQQRVSLMRALMLEPSILLMDEPLGALDPMIRAGLQEELGEAFETLGTTVLLVTHDMDEAAFFGDRLTLMRQGSIVQTGTIDEIVRDPGDDFVRRFVRAQRSELSERLGDLGGGEGAA